MEVLSTARMSSTIESTLVLDSLPGLLVLVNSSESSTGQPGPDSSLVRQHPLLQVLTTGFGVCHHNWHQRPCIHSSTKLGGGKHGPL